MVSSAHRAAAAASLTARQAARASCRSASCARSVRDAFVAPDACVARAGVARESCGGLVVRESLAHVEHRPPRESHGGGRTNVLPHAHRARLCQANLPNRLAVRGQEHGHCAPPPSKQSAVANANVENGVRRFLTLPGSARLTRDSTSARSMSRRSRARCLVAVSDADTRATVIVRWVLSRTKRAV